MLEHGLNAPETTAGKTALSVPLSVEFGTLVSGGLIGVTSSPAAGIAGPQKSAKPSTISKNPWPAYDMLEPCRLKWNEWVCMIRVQSFDDMSACPWAYQRVYALNAVFVTDREYKF
jgi:hypothetical protein